MARTQCVVTAGGRAFSVDHVTATLERAVGVFVAGVFRVVEMVQIVIGVAGRLVGDGQAAVRLNGEGQ